MVTSETSSENNAMLTIDPSKNENTENYKLLIGSIVPRPIAWVSTISLNGVANLAPYSFFTGVCSTPPTVLFCPMIKSSDGQKKDSLRNIEVTGEFVVNIVSESLAEAMNQSAADLPYGEDEFQFAGLDKVASHIVKPPRIKTSPISLECKLQQIIPVGEGGIGSGFVVLGTVVLFHVASALYDKGRIDTQAMEPIGRLAGASYCTVKDSFALERPQ